MSDPFGELRAAKHVERMAANLDQIAEHARRQMEPVQRVLKEFHDASAWVRDLRPKLVAIGEQFEHAVQRAKPPNWDEEFSFELLLDRGDIIAREGIPLVWVPDGPVVTELSSLGSEADQLAALDEHSSAVVDACEARLDEVTDAELAGPVHGIGLAVDAWRGGHPEGAQALATVAMDTTVTRVFGLRAWEARKHFDQDLEQVALRVIRRAMVLVAVHRALDNFDADADPIPVRYNRHATVHAISPEQYTSANALVAMMLAASLVRETQQLAADNGG